MQCVAILPKGLFFTQRYCSYGSLKISFLLQNLEALIISDIGVGGGKLPLSTSFPLSSRKLWHIKICCFFFYLSYSFMPCWSICYVIYLILFYSIMYIINLPGQSGRVRPQKSSYCVGNYTKYRGECCSDFRVEYKRQKK